LLWEFRCDYAEQGTGEDRDRGYSSWRLHDPAMCKIRYDN